MSQLYKYIVFPLKNQNRGRTERLTDLFQNEVFYDHHF